MSNRLLALSLCKHKATRPHGRKYIARDINEVLHSEKIIFCIQDGRCPPQVLLNLRRFHVEVALDNTNFEYLKKFDKTFFK